MNKEEIYKSIEHIAKCGLYDTIEVNFLKSKFDELQQENKILRENAENNDKVVDKVNWENNLLKQQNQKYKELIDKIKDIFNNGHFEDGCDCLEIEELLDNLKEVE